MNYVNVYEDLIRKLYIHINANYVLSTIFVCQFDTPFQLNDMMTLVMKVVTKPNPESDLVIIRLSLYYDMKLVTFGIDDNADFIIQFPVYVQPYSRLTFTLYQIEVVLVTVIDQFIYFNSYTEIQILKTYITLSDEIYISLRH